MKHQGIPEVRSIICKRDVELGIECLGSLKRFCADPLRIVLHDDGSIGSDERARLEDGLPGAILITKEEADDVMNPVLKTLPRCTAFRERSPMGRKLVDVGVFSKGDIILCDTDVLFFRQFKGAFTWPETSIKTVHVLDVADSFCLKPWQTGPLHLLHRFNAGFMMIRKELFDLDLMERTVGLIEDNPGYIENKPYQWFLEQTCWASVAGEHPAMMWSSNQFRVIGRNDRYSTDLVGGHFVGNVRHMLAQFRDKARKAAVEQAEPVSIQFERARPYSTPAFIANRLGNRLRYALAS